MIKRLYRVVWANVSDFIHSGKDPVDRDLGFEERDSSTDQGIEDPSLYSLGSLDEYYANLELPLGAGRKEVKQAWKKLLKKYHPDLRSNNPEKRKIATELTGRLNEAYRILDKELSNKG